MQNTKVGRAAAHARRVTALQRRIDTAEEAKRQQEASLAEVQAEISALQDTLAKAEKYNARATAEIRKLDAEVEVLPPEQKVREELSRTVLVCCMNAECTHAFTKGRVVGEVARLRQRARSSCV